MRKVLKPKNIVSKPKKALGQLERPQSKPYYATVQGQQFVVELSKVRNKHIHSSHQYDLELMRRNTRRNRTVRLAQSGIEVLGWVSIITISALILDNICHFRGFFLVSVWVFVCLPLVVIVGVWFKNQLR